MSPPTIQGLPLALASATAVDNRPRLRGVMPSSVYNYSETTTTPEGGPIWSQAADILPPECAGEWS